MDIKKLRESTDQELAKEIQNNVEKLDYLKNLSQELLKRMIRKRKDPRNDLWLYLSIEEDNTRIILDKCLYLLKDSIGFEEKVKTLNTLNILGGFLTELEFAAFFKEKGYTIEFEAGRLGGAIG